MCTAENATIIAEAEPKSTLERVAFCNKNKKVAAAEKASIRAEKKAETRKDVQKQ